MIDGIINKLFPNLFFIYYTEMKIYESGGESQSMKKRVLFAITLLILIVGVPFIINESYKVNKGYITLWGASEVLSYYGTVLGASTTILAVIYTIRFTRKQINYDYSISQEKLKWEKVDNLLQEHFKKIMPTEILQIYTSSEKVTNPMYYVEQILIRIIEIKTSLDWIKSYINPDEYKLISNYIDMLLSVDEEICTVCSKIVGFLEQFAKNNLHTKAQQAIDNKNTPLNTDELNMYKKIIVDNPYTNPEEILESLDTCSQELLAIQEKQFHNLLNSKRDIFYKIFSDLNDNEKKIR